MKNTDIYISNLTSFRDKCEQAVGISNIKICVENTSAFCHSVGKNSLSLLLESPVFALTFDTGHDAGSNFKQRPVIDTHIDRLAHMHLHDALVNEHKRPFAFWLW